MGKPIKIFIFILLLTGSLSITSAQQTNTLTKPFLEFKDNTLIISYSFPQGCKGKYKVWVQIKDSQGSTIEASSFSGDIGANIDPGSNKRIMWNMGSDSIFLNDAVSVKVLAEQMPKHFSKIGLFASSALLPGLGQSRLSGRPYWIAGAAAYGCLAGSYWFNRKAVYSYQFYLDSDIRQENDDYFNKTVSQDRISKTLAWSSLGIWTANLLWMAVMPDKRDTGNNEKRINLGLKPDVSDFGHDISLYLTINLVR